MSKRTILLPALTASFLLAAAGGTPKPPTIQDLGGMNVGDGIDRNELGMIRAYVQNVWNDLVKAKTVEEVTKARQAMLQAYRVHTSASYRYEYAKAAAAGIGAALSLKGDPLRRVKELNAAMAIAGMPESTIQPALEKMARHANSSVRYWAAKGYRTAGGRMQVQAGSARRMRNALEKLGMSEKVGAVVGGVLRAASDYPSVSPDRTRELRKVLEKVWRKHCDGVHAGKPDFIEAYRRAIVYLPATNAQDKRFALRLLLDLMEAAKDPLQKATDADDPTGRGLVELLLQLEDQLAAILPQTAKPIRAIFDGSEPWRRQVLLAAVEINNYKAKIGKEYKLQVQWKPPPPPATAPATAPTTAPAPAPPGG